MKIVRDNLELKDRDYMIIREISYIMGIEPGDIISRMLDKWLSSKECGVSVRRYIDEYKIDLESNR